MVGGNQRRQTRQQPDLEIQRLVRETLCAWHGRLEKSGEVMRVVWKGLPTPPCPGMQTNSSFPCCLCCFDRPGAGHATLLDIPGTREACENSRVSGRFFWGLRGKLQTSEATCLLTPCSFHKTLSEREGGREGGKGWRPHVTEGKFRMEEHDQAMTESAGLGWDYHGFDSKGRLSHRTVAPEPQAPP